MILDPKKYPGLQSAIWRHRRADGGSFSLKTGRLEVQEQAMFQTGPLLQLKAVRQVQVPFPQSFALLGFSVNWMRKVFSP